MRFFVIWLSASCLVSCRTTEPPRDGGHSEPGHASIPSSKQYTGVGHYLFHETEDAQTRVSINHESIPGFMDAMAMSFVVKDASLVRGLEPGARIRFRVLVEDGGFYHIDQILPQQ